MKLTTDAVAEIKAAEGLYRAADVARTYDVHRSTITRIWDGHIHSDVSPAADYPNIATRTRAVDVAEDINLLLSRGMSIQEVADYFDITPKTVYQYRGIWL